jgi:lipopolysaccharide assembly protein A
MLRLITALGISILFLVLVLQNLGQVSLNFLFWSFESSLALLLITTIALSIVLSLIIAFPIKLKRYLDKNKKEKVSDELKPKS